MGAHSGAGAAISGAGRNTTSRCGDSTSGVAIGYIVSRQGTAAKRFTATEGSIATTTDIGSLSAASALLFVISGLQFTIDGSVFAIATTIISAGVGAATSTVGADISDGVTGFIASKRSIVTDLCIAMSTVTGVWSAESG